MAPTTRSQLLRWVAGEAPFALYPPSEALDPRSAVAACAAAASLLPCTCTHTLHLHPCLHLQLHPRLRLRLQLPTTTTTTIIRCVACFAPSAALFRDFCRERAIAPPAYIPLCLASSSLASRRSATGVRMTLRATPQRSQPPPPPSPWHVRQSL